MKIIARPPRKNRRAGRHHHNRMRGPRILANATSAGQKKSPARLGGLHMRRNISKNFSPNIRRREEQKRTKRAFPPRMILTCRRSTLEAVTPFPRRLPFCPRTQPNYFRCACPSPASSSSSSSSSSGSGCGGIGCGGGGSCTGGRGASDGCCCMMGSFLPG
jgi:uncharacterized membrane protein YgcG